MNVATAGKTFVLATILCAVATACKETIAQSAVLVPPTGSEKTSPSTAASSTASPRTPAPQDCFATLTTVVTASRVGRKAGDWVRVGTVAVTMQDRKPLRFDVRDKDGKSVANGEAPDNATEFKDAVRVEVCRVGGVSILSDGEPPASGAYALSIWRPVAPSESQDLAFMCSGPPDVLGDRKGSDAKQTRVLALETYEVMLTSSRWRGFVRGLRADLKASKDGDIASVRSAKAAELRSAKPQCWFSDALER